MTFCISLYFFIFYFIFYFIFLFGTRGLLYLLEWNESKLPKFIKIYGSGLEDV